MSDGIDHHSFSMRLLEFMGEARHNAISREGAVYGHDSSDNKPHMEFCIIALFDKCVLEVEFGFSTSNASTGLWSSPGRSVRYRKR